MCSLVWGCESAPVVLVAVAVEVAIDVVVDDNFGFPPLCKNYDDNKKIAFLDLRKGIFQNNVDVH